MKTITMLLGMMLMVVAPASAQVASNQANQPDVEQPYQYVEVRYYYYPNLEIYFDTKVAMYLHEENGQWVESEAMPPVTNRGYSLKNGQYVMLTDYTGDEPYTMLEAHKQQYPADFSTKRKPPVKKSNETAATHKNSLQSHATTLASND